MARILARAQEIDAAHTDAADTDGIEPLALIEAAAEVGIDRDAVRDSLAVDRLSEVPPAQHFDGLAGRRILMVERQLAMSAVASVDAIEAWLASAHRLSCDRRSPTSLHARRRTDTAASIARSVDGLRGEGKLGSLESLTVEAAPLIVGSGPTTPRALVRIGASRTSDRQVRLGIGGATVVGGVGAGVAVVAVSGLIALLPIVSLPLVGGGFLVARSGRSHADRMESELQRLLSLVERGETPVPFLGAMVQRAQRSFRPARR